MKKKDWLLQIREKSVKELEQEINKAYKVLLDLRMKLTMGKQKNQRELRNKRKQLARMKTVMTEKRKEKK